MYIFETKHICKVITQYKKYVLLLFLLSFSFKKFKKSLIFINFLNLKIAIF